MEDIQDFKGWAERCYHRCIEISTKLNLKHFCKKYDIIIYYIKVILGYRNKRKNIMILDYILKSNNLDLYSSFFLIQNISRAFGLTFMLLFPQIHNFNLKYMFSFRNYVIQSLP